MGEQRQPEPYDADAQNGDLPQFVWITEDGEIYNVIFRFVARFFMGYNSNIEGYLNGLGRKFGEPVQIEN